MPGGECDYKATPQTLSVAAGGGSISFSVTTAGNCSWTSVSESAFVHITSGSAGVGNGGVSLTVDQNLDSDGRVGLVRLESGIVLIQQAGVGGSSSSCSFGTSFIADDLPDFGYLTITTSPGCAWTLATTGPWIALDTQSGEGTAVVGVSIDRFAMPPGATVAVNVSATATPATPPSLPWPCFDLVPPCVDCRFPPPPLRFCVPQLGRLPQPAPPTEQVEILDFSLDRGEATIRLSGTSSAGVLTVGIRGKVFTETPFVAASVQAGPGQVTVTFDPAFVQSWREGDYFEARATWNGKTGRRDVAFRSMGVVTHTLYNVPQETSCPGTRPTTDNAFRTAQGGVGNCTFNVGLQLRPQFVTQTWLNGTGITVEGNILKHPDQCSGVSANPRDNKFWPVASVTGAYNLPLTVIGLIGEWALVEGPAFAQDLL